MVLLDYIMVETDKIYLDTDVYIVRENLQSLLRLQKTKYLQLYILKT